LQTFGQRDVAFAAENDMRMLEAGVYEPEMVEAVIERFGGDRDAEIGHVGEIRQPRPAGFVDLAENHLLRPRHALLAMNGCGRSSVRRAPGDKCGWRRCISSKIATARRTWRRLQHRITSASKKSARGSGGGAFAPY